MKPYDIHDLAIKLVGVFMALSLLDSVLMMFRVFGSDDFYSVEAIPGYGLLFGMCIVAWLCVFNTDFIHKIVWSNEKYEDNETPQRTGTASLSFWLTLMGFYFGLFASVGFLNLILTYVINYTEGQGFYSVPYLASQALQLILALTLIFGAKHIERFINAVQTETREEAAQPTE